MSESCMDIKRKSLGQKTLNPTSNFHVSHVSWSATHHRRGELSSEYSAKYAVYITQRLHSVGPEVPVEFILLFDLILGFRTLLD